jgi:hypothetical protein
VSHFNRVGREVTDAVATVLEESLDDYLVSHGMPATRHITVGLLTTQIIFEDGTVVWLETEQKESIDA